MESTQEKSNGLIVESLAPGFEVVLEFDVVRVRVGSSAAMRGHEEEADEADVDADQVDGEGPQRAEDEAEKHVVKTAT